MTFVGIIDDVTWAMITTLLLVTFYLFVRDGGTYDR